MKTLKIRGCVQADVDGNYPDESGLVATIEEKEK